METPDAQKPAQTATSSADAEIRVDVYLSSIDKPLLAPAPAPATYSTQSQPPQYSTQPQPPPNSQRDYVTRRMELFEHSSDVEMGAVSQLPLPMQVAFRVKMLTIFALQLLLVGTLAGLCAFYAPVNDVVKTAFQVQLAYLGAAAGALVALLGLLYFIRTLFPLNWLVLLVFSAAQAALFAALGVKFDTYLGVFNCAATFGCVVIMLLLSGVRRRRPGGGVPKLLSPVTAGLVAYVVVALVASALYIRFGRAFVTPEGFGGSLAFQLVLVLWFALDAAFMCQVMSPDEYMHGVIYFYTDMQCFVCCLDTCIDLLPRDCCCNVCDCDCRRKHSRRSSPNAQELESGWEEEPTTSTSYQPSGEPGWVEPHKDASTGAMREQEMQRV
ncbi:hypothetical protein PybrP1_008944 [[Pythium] brassicae (nom. inval.)]|nr:hypothetical protein PybrP1_008944 [[Pythium] brassicae (nom. inval.)]